MKNEPDKPLSKNETVELEISALGSDGQGIGRHEGFVVFVPFALPGELVRALIVKVSKDYAVGKLLGVLRASPSRAEPACAAFGRCGGCQLQHMEYAAQLGFKRQAVADALRKIGGIENPEVLPVIGMENPWHYRNKGTFPMKSDEVGGEAGGVVAGMYAQRSHRVVPVEECPIQPEAIRAAVAAVRRWAGENGVPPYDEETGEGLLRGVLARSFAQTHETLVAVIANGTHLPAADALVRALRDAVPGLAGVVQNINTKRTNVVLGPAEKTLWGRPHAAARLGSLTYYVGAKSFFQVNTAQTERLYAEAADAALLTGSELLVDAYCGVGTIGQYLAARAGRVIGIESVPESVEEAKASAERNGIINAEYICGKAEEVLSDMAKNGLRPSVILMDPPRKGCDAKFLEAAAETGAARLVYVSCNPATMARDIRILMGMGYDLKKVQPVDMFPQTADVECVALLSRIWR
jgi:23S rRNA (uracil1939-C5)-methyltransferase